METNPRFITTITEGIYIHTMKNEDGLKSRWVKLSHSALRGHFVAYELSIEWGFHPFKQVKLNSADSTETVAQLTPRAKVSASRVIALGVLHETCVWCNDTLGDGPSSSSRKAGYHTDCGKHMGIV